MHDTNYEEGEKIQQQKTALIGFEPTSTKINGS